MIDWVNNIGVGERAGLFEVVPHRPEKYQLDGKRTSYLPFLGLRIMCGELPVICHGGTSPLAVDCTQLFAMGRDLADAVK